MTRQSANRTFILGGIAFGIIFGWFLPKLIAFSLSAFGVLFLKDLNIAFSITGALCGLMCFAPVAMLVAEIAQHYDYFGLAAQTESGGQRVEFMIWMNQGAERATNWEEIFSGAVDAEKLERFFQRESENSLLLETAYDSKYMILSFGEPHDDGCARKQRPLLVKLRGSDDIVRSLETLWDGTLLTSIPLFSDKSTCCYSLVSQGCEGTPIARLHFVGPLAIMPRIFVAALAANV